MKIELYSKPHCTFCDAAKKFFDSNSVRYTVHDINDSDENYQNFLKLGMRSVPQIVVDGKHIGNYDSLMQQREMFLFDKPVTMVTPSESYKPFRYPWAVELTKRHEQAHWIEDEIDLSDDVSDWKSDKLKPHEKDFITQVLRLFTQSDVAVGQNYYEFFIPKLKNNEIRNMLGSFASREGIHQRAYALLNDTLGLPESEFQSFLEYKAMSNKVDFMRDNDNSNYSNLAMAIAKSVMSEGISLFASFVMLLNFQRFGKMKGMCKVVEWSVRDETMHVEGMTQLFRKFCEEHPRVVTDEFKLGIYDMLRTVVGLEDKFIDLAYDKHDEMYELAKGDVKKYIRHIADRRLLQLGLKPNYKVKDNPLPWLDWVLNAPDHTNFFENRVTEYEVGSLKGSWGDVYTT
jgi:ribonucleotide reductase beta subunit family protein with ferritin-like domain/glutaredoxin